MPVVNEYTQLMKFKVCRFCHVQPNCAVEDGLTKDYRISNNSKIWNCVYEISLCKNTEHLILWYFRNTFTNVKFLIVSVKRRPLEVHYPEVSKLHFRHNFSKGLFEFFKENQIFITQKCENKTRLYNIPKLLVLKEIITPFNVSKGAMKIFDICS